LSIFFNNKNEYRPEALILNFGPFTANK
jgi:hypothetical protein